MLRKTSSFLFSLSISMLLSVSILSSFVEAQEAFHPPPGSSALDMEGVPSAIASYNRQIRAARVMQTETSNVLRPNDLSGLLATLTARQKLFEAFLASGYEAASAVRLTAEERERVIRSLPESAALVEDDTEVQGSAQQLVMDDFQHKSSKSTWRVATPQERFTLYFGSRAVPVELLEGGRIKVNGLHSGHGIAVSAVAVARPSAAQPKTVDKAAAVSSQASIAPPVCSTLGNQKIAVLMMTTPSNTTYPTGWDANFFQDAFFGTSDLNLNTYWQQASYGQTSSSGQVYGPFALTRDYTCGVDDGQMMTDAVAAASSSVDFTQFDRVAITFPVQSCTYGGLGSIGCGPGLVANQAVSEAWFPIFPGQPTNEFISISAHELGHNLGLNHGNTDDYGTISLGPLDMSGTDTEYGDPYTVMGADYSVSGEYVGQHKATLLNWLGYGAYEEVSGSGTYSMSPLENPGGVKTLRVTRNPLTDAALWLEYRQPLGIVDSTFQNLPAGASNVYGGATIHYQDPNLDSLHTYLLDFNPVDNPNNFQTSALTPGQSWSDPYSLLTLTAQTADTTGMAMTVSYDQPCATLQLSAASYSASGANGTIAVTAPSNCAWKASTAESWIAVNSGASGQGNGTVNFTAAPNSAVTQRTGFITVQRQSLAVLQAGTSPLLIPTPSATPVTGYNGHFIFSVTDANGVSDISETSSNFHGLPNTGCNVATDGGQFQNAFFLLADDNSSYQGFNGATSISNSQCTLYNDSVQTVSGNTLTTNLHISFAANISGNHLGNVYVSSATVAGVGPLNLGVWEVGYNGPVASMNSQLLRFGTLGIGSSATQTTTLTNTGQTALNMGTVSFTGATPNQFSQTNNCGTSVAVGASCTFSIKFSPSMSGVLTATMNIADSANGSPQLVFLQGTGQYTLRASPSSVSFDNEIVSTASPAQTVTLTNIGAASVAISSIGVTGTNASNYSETNNCPSSLAVNASCNVSVTFKPVASGTTSANLAIVYVPSGSAAYTVNVPLTGTGVTGVSAPSFSLLAGTYAGTQSVAIADATAEASIYYTTNGTTPSASSTKYTSAISVAATETIKAVAIVSGYTPSAVSSAAYTIVNPVADQTSLTVSPTSGGQGAIFTLQAAVTTGGTHVSAGSVTFYDGSTVLGTVPVVSAAGIATFKTASLLPGANSITAKFNRNNLNAASTSNTVNVTVTTQFPSLSILTSSGSQGSYVLTSAVSAQGGATPSGTFTFNDVSTGTVLGSAPVANVVTTFGAEMDVSVQSSPNDVATGDVNGDGIPDIVVASYNGSTNWITVALGKGDGTFGAPTQVATNSGTSNGGPTVALADLNGDGKLDILAGSWAGQGVVVFLGNGNGTFGPEADFAVDNSYTNSIAVGDVNGDGKLDVVTSDPFGNSMSVLLGKGDGTFQTEQPFATDTSPESVALADFNNDGRLDAVVANTTGTVSVFLGNGDGTFQPQARAPVTSNGEFLGPRGVAVGDFNGDGKQDIVVAVWNQGTVGVLFGNGDGTFRAAKFVTAPGANPNGIAVGDINHDGKADMAVSSYNGGIATVMIGNGDGTFQTKAYPVDGQQQGVSIADFNGDGILDVVTVGSATNAASTILGKSSFTGTLMNVTLPGVTTDNVNAVYSGDPIFASSTSNTISLPSNASAAATPTFSPVAGTYSSAQSVKIADTTAGAVIYYTINGATPSASSPKYASAISVATTETIKAIAIAAGYGNSAVASAAYTISGSGAPSVSISPASFAFSNTNIGSTAAYKALTLTNTGNASLTITSITVSGTNASSFSIPSNRQGCTTVAATASCTFYVAFTPTAAGSLAASVLIADNATGSPQAVAVSGMGISPTAPVVSLSPASFAFSNTNVGSTAAYKAFTLTNTGNASLTVTSITVGGANASSFSIPSNRQGCATVAANASCTFHVAFTPTAAGSLSASILIADNAAASPQSVAVSGTGVATAGPKVVISPASFTFSNTNVGSTAAYKVFTLTNTGNASLTISSITVSGTNASSFSIPSNHQGCTTVAANASCMFDVAFTPTTAASLSASVLITDNATGSPQSVAVSGTGVAIAGPAVSLSPTSFTFSNTNVGSTAAYKAFTLTNTGNASLTVTSITVAGTNASSFRIPSNRQGCTTVAANASCTFYVAFTPATSGSLSASVLIADNATGSPQSVAVAGTGVN